PHNYEFVFLTGGSCGHMAMFLYFKLLKINRNWTSQTEFEKYKIAYNVFNLSKGYNIFSCQWDQESKKLFYLVNNIVPLVVLLRDPIERIKSLTNHIVKHVDKFDLSFNPENVLINKYYKMKDCPSLEKIDSIVENSHYFNISQKISYFTNITEVITLDIKDIIGERCYKTFCFLSQKLNFQYPSKDLKQYFITPFVSKVMDMLPLTLEINKHNVNILLLEDKIEIIITFTKMMLYCNQENLVDLKKDFFSNISWNIQDEILFLVSKKDEDKLKNNYSLFLIVQEYLKNFMNVFEEKIKQEKKKLFNTEDILNYFKENRKLRLKLKSILDNEMIFTKKYCSSDIVASWKYYQEFEKMCEELDS
ncbi:DUF2972 domain-containing protein, partial [Campylobacter sp. RM10543]|uniref:DUF2972 domain-containing protein n=1 Tax=Campylobacter molothri TaxID=1032242 RepID=UPI00301DCF0E|nr:DUF2972 domain-containing protein [Campylobacter sp. RM10543]